MAVSRCHRGTPRSNRPSHRPAPQESLHDGECRFDGIGARRGTDRGAGRGHWTRFRQPRALAHRWRPGKTRSGSCGGFCGAVWRWCWSWRHCRPEIAQRTPLTVFSPKYCAAGRSASRSRSLIGRSGSKTRTAICKAMRSTSPIGWIKTNAAGRVAMLQTKKADITISSFTPNLERLKTIGFTDPYSTAVLSLLSRTDRKDLGSVADFNRPEVKFAIPRGSTVAKAIATYTPKATVVEFSGFADMIAALYAGQADAMAIPEAMVNWTAKNSGGKYHNAGALGPPEAAAIGFPQGDFVWWMWLNRFVREINEDGTNYTLRIKWLGDAPMPPFIKPPPKSG